MPWRWPLAAGAVLASLICGPVHPAVAIALIALAALVGLPHGALDHALASRHIAHVRGRKGWLLFHAVYVALALGFALALIAYPLPGFALFCVMSAWHFGQSDLLELGRDATWGPLAWLTRGAMILAVSILGHADQAIPFIEILLGQEFSSVATVRLPLTWVSICVCIVHVLVVVRACRRLEHSPGSTAREIGDVIALATMLWVLDPLLGFGLYFVFWHSFDHARRARAELQSSWKELSGTAFAYTFAALAGTLVLALVLANTELWMSSTWLIQVLAVLIAAVTLPHMFVVESTIARMYSPIK